MKTGKRILSIFLVALMLLTAAPLAGFVGLEIAPKAKALDATGQCGENVFWSFDETTGALTITGSGAMQDYPAWPSPYRKIKSVSIGDGVTSIGDGAFRGCTSLTSVTIPDSVTSIEEEAFLNCTSLTGVTIPDGVTYILSHTFDNCTALASVTIPDSVTYIGHTAFGSCSSLMSVTIPDSVTEIDTMAFCQCTALASVTIPDSVTRIGRGAFFACTALTSVTIPDSVTHIHDGTFENCTALTNVTIPDSVTSIGEWAFHGCSALTSVTIPDSVTSIDDEAFYDCRSLMSMTIPTGVPSIGHYAFRSCVSLESVTIPNSVTFIGMLAFKECISLKDVYYNGTQEEWNKISIGEGNECLTNATIHFNSSGEQPPTDIARYNIYAFSNKPNLAIGAHDSLEMIFQLEKVPLDGAARLVKDASFTFTSSDTSIFSIASIDRQSDMTTIRINGNHSGTAILSVSAFDQNGLKDSKKFHIVVSGETVYYADNMPSYDIDCNGITIDNFVYDKSDSDYCTISFDAYNQVNCYGAVEVRDKDDNLLYTQAIDRYDGNLLPDGLIDSFISAFSQHDFNCDYKNEEYSTKTEIYISGIPRDGHIVISNDIVSSPAAAVYNISHLAIEGISKTIKLASSLSSADKAVKEATKEVGKEVLDTIVKTADKTIRKTSTSMLKKIMTTSNYGSETGLNQTLKTYYLYLDQLDIDVVDIMLSALKKAAQGAVLGLIEKAIYELMGVPGKIAEKVFDAIGFNNLLHEAEKIGECAESGNVCIYCTPMYNEIRYSNGYMVRQSDPFDDNVSFHTYKIVNKEKRDEVSKQFEEHMIELFSMALYKDGMEVQPEGKVEVAIPVPKGVNVFHMSIYRQEADGSFTKLNLSFNGQDGYYFNDGYIYIQTDHFSLYCMTGEVEPMQTVAFSQSSVTLNVNDTFTQYPEIVPEISDDLIEDWLWQSSDESVAQVTETGTVVAVGEGQAVISALDGAATYTVTVNPEQHTHTDNNNDGKCDTCGEKMTGGKHCKYCGKIHGGAFGWLVKFFHSIFAIFKR